MCSPSPLHSSCIFTGNWWSWWWSWWWYWWSCSKTLGIALTDSPVGLAAYLVEKYRAWSDCDGVVERRFTKDELLTMITLYWVGGLHYDGFITSSMRIYYEFFRNEFISSSDFFVTQPTACAAFPTELFVSPPTFVKYFYHLQRFTYMPRGGHFAALEGPSFSFSTHPSCLVSLHSLNMLCIPQQSLVCWRKIFKLFVLSFFLVSLRPQQNPINLTQSCNNSWFKLHYKNLHKRATT